MTEQAAKLLKLKGVTVEEETVEPVESGKILEMYQKKKVDQQNPDRFDDLDLKWNLDGTLNRMVAYRKGEVLYEMDFAWNPNGSLSKIMRR